MTDVDNPSYFREIVCLECGGSSGAVIMALRCPHCGLHWLDARCDYAAVAALWQHGLPDRVHSLWRYHELLPITEPDAEIAMMGGIRRLSSIPVNICRQSNTHGLRVQSAFSSRMPASAGMNSSP